MTPSSSNTISFRRRCRGALRPLRIALALLLAMGGICFAQEPAPAARETSKQETSKLEAAQPGPTSRPMLEQLDRETRSLYREVRAGMVCVQLPPRRAASDGRANPLIRWNTLTPEMREKLSHLEPGVTYSDDTVKVNPPAPPPASGNPANEKSPLPERSMRLDDDSATTRPATPPSTRPASRVTGAYGYGTVIIVPQAKNAAVQDDALGGRLDDPGYVRMALGSTQIALVLDDKGYILVPQYVQRESVEAQGLKLKLTDPQGKPAEAQFVGADRQTNLTVLKLDQPAGKAVRLGDARPEDGSVVLYVSTLDGVSRLGVWTGAPRDWGVVVTPQGSVAGIARGGQLLGGSACRLIADQIIRFGAVKRATLGVMITEIRKDDPMRQRLPALGARSAMRVDQVMPGSAAENAGLRPGDILTALAGDPVSDIPSFAAAIAARNGKTELQVLRGSETLTITADLEQK